MQHARHKQQKREKLAKMEGEILNPVHVENPSEDQNAATTAVQSAKPTPVLSQSAKPTLPAPVALDVPESAKPTHKSAKPTSPADAALGSLESAKLTSDSCCLGCLRGVLR